MNRRLLIIIGICLVVLLGVIVLAVAFGGNRGKQPPKQDSGQITLTYWRPVDDKEVFEPLIEQYQKENSNIRIEYRKIGLAGYQQALVDAFASGKGPDMFAINNNWMPEFTDRISPIDEKKLTVDDYSRTFFDVAKQDNVINNRIYGIPYSIDTLALFVNNQLISQAGVDPPTTWEGLVGKPGDPAKPGILSKLNNRQGNTINQSAIALGNASVNRAPDVLALMMLQNQTIMVNGAKDRALFNLTQKVEGVSPDPHLGTDSLKFYTSFADPQSANYSWNSSLGDSVKAFADGRVAMTLSYAYQIQNLKRLNPNLDYRVEPAPQIGGRDPINYANYWTETVARTSQHQSEAWEFIKFMSGKDSMLQFSEAAQTVPSRKDVNPSASNLQAFYDQNKSAVSWYKGNASKADQIFIDMINQVLGGEDPQRAIDTAANAETNVLQGLKSTPAP